MAITRDQIWTVADELDAAGQNPTLAAVRKAVGGGSFTTIQEAMVEWKAKRAAKAAAEHVPAPPALSARLADLGGQIWATAMEMATARLEVDRAALEKERAEIDAARVEAAELADQLNAELDEARDRLERQGAALTAAEADAGQLREALVVAKAQADAATRQAEVERQAATGARAGEAEAREAVARLHGRIEALEAQRDDLLARLGTAKDPGTR